MGIFVQKFPHSREQKSTSSQEKKQKQMFISLQVVAWVGVLVKTKYDNENRLFSLDFSNATLLIALSSVKLQILFF